MHLPVQLSSPAYPLVQALALAGIGLLCLGLRRYGTAAAFALAGATWLALCATPAFADWLRQGLENQYPPQEASRYLTADAIVVLGGSPFLHAESAWESESPSVLKSRLGFGFLLFKNARAPIILLSGGNGDARAMARMLSRQGVPTAAMMLETASRDTHQNAAYSAQLLGHAGLHRVLLVTSSRHMPRAAATFRKQGLDVIPAPALDRPAAHAHAGTPWHPGAVLLRSELSLREYLGLLYYKLRGWA